MLIVHLKKLLNLETWQTNQKVDYNNSALLF